MGMFPTAIECLASELEETKSELTLSELENEVLRQRVKELERDRQNLVHKRVHDYLGEIQDEAIVELANRLAPVLGVTKDNNFTQLVRNYLKREINMKRCQACRTLKPTSEFEDNDKVCRTCRKMTNPNSRE